MRMSESELEAAEDHYGPRSFTRPYRPPHQIEVLRGIAQQMMLKRGVQVVLDRERSEAWLNKLLGRIAVVIGMSYAECGDAAKITDDEALMLIRELLLEADENVIERHRGRKLPRRLRNVLSGL